MTSLHPVNWPHFAPVSSLASLVVVVEKEEEEEMEEEEMEEEENL